MKIVKVVQYSTCGSPSMDYCPPSMDWGTPRVACNSDAFLMWRRTIPTNIISTLLPIVTFPDGKTFLVYNLLTDSTIAPSIGLIYWQLDKCMYWWYVCYVWGAGIWADNRNWTELGSQLLITGLGYWIIQEVRNREKKDQDAKNRGTQLSDLRLASAANGNDDKDIEIAHWFCFPMKQRKSDTGISQTQPSPWVAPWQYVCIDQSMVECYLRWRLTYEM